MYLSLTSVFICVSLVAVVAVASCGTANRGALTSTYQAPDPTTSAQNPRSARRHFTEGSLLDMREHYREAITEYRRAIELDSSLGAAYYAIGKSYRALRKNDSAVYYTQIALALDSTEIRAREQLADLLVIAGDVERAVEQYEAILSVRPDDLAARYMAARLLQNRHADRAVEHYEYMLKNLTDDFDVMLRLADLYLENEDNDGALRILRRMVQLDPQSAELRSSLITVLLDAGRFADAIAAVAAAEEAIPTSTELDRFLSDELAGASERLRNPSRWSDSLGTYARALVARSGAASDAWHVRYHAGLLALRLRDTAMAEAMLARAVADVALDDEAWLEIATRLLDSAGAPLAVRILGGSVTRHTSARVPYLFGILHEIAGNDDSASHWLRWGIENFEELGESWEALARIAARHGDYTMSDSAYQRAIRIDPDNAIALNNFAYSLARRGTRLPEALAMAGRAVAISGDNAAFLDTHGWVLLRLGDVRRALQSLRRAAELDGTNVEILRHLAEAEAIAGDPDAASGTLEPAEGSADQGAARGEAR